MVHVGIDIGTSNAVVSVVTSNGPEARFVEGGVLTPSVVYVEEHGGRHEVGTPALDRWADPTFDQSRLYRRWKLRMGEGQVLDTLQFGGSASDRTEITPELLTTWLVEHLVAGIAEGSGGDQVESVLVTVPHGWRRENPEKCAATRRAAARARHRGTPIEVQPQTVSEPVAAAAYWLWAARRDDEQADFAGHDVLVVDVGGGTFDLSMVRVGRDDAPLRVQDAANNESAGDFATALVMGLVARRFNEEHQAQLPTDADQLLAEVASGDTSWARRWFAEAQELKISLSAGIRQATRTNRPPRPSRKYIFEVDDQETSVQVAPDEFIQTLEAFYERSRDLVAHFLQHRKTCPHAVVLAGGGSRIAGLTDHVLAPVLTQQWDAATASSALTRIAINDNQIDQAIAHGAALVANGLVSVEEHLICDVGLVLGVPDNLGNRSLREELKLEPDQGHILVTPLLKKGAKLPATFTSSSELSGVVLTGKSATEAGVRPTRVEPAELDVQVVLDDGTDESWTQTWLITGNHTGELSFDIMADADGMLHFSVSPRDGGQSVVSCSLVPERTGRAQIVIQLPDHERDRSWNRVTPKDLLALLGRVRSPKARTALAHDPAGQPQ